jgi:hypothetical protein
LLVHGAILSVVALGSAVATSIGWRTGAGPFGFMHQNPMVWVGLIQAYLLMTIIAVLLIIGSRQENPRKWNVVGALAHCPPLIAALSSLDVFDSMGALGLVRVAIAFHFLWLALEAFAALYPTRVGALVVLGSFAAGNLGAQKSESIRAGVGLERNSLAPAMTMTAKVSTPVSRDTTESRWVRASNGALIGAGIGAAAGLVTALIVTHGNGVSDHSEDAIAYVYLPAFGAFVGLVVGSIVGLTRH